MQPIDGMGNTGRNKVDFRIRQTDERAPRGREESFDSVKVLGLPQRGVQEPPCPPLHGGPVASPARSVQSPAQ